MPVVAVHGRRGAKLALTRIGTVLARRPPQMEAACWNTMRRCWPSVVPAFPPTGATEVVSLRPVPAGSELTMTMFAAKSGLAASEARRRSGRSERRSMSPYFSRVAGAGITLLLGVDRFMSEMRALTNLVGNGVATIVVAIWEGEFDRQQAQRVLNGEVDVEGSDPLLELCLARPWYSQHLGGQVD